MAFKAEWLSLITILSLVLMIFISPSSTTIAHVTRADCPTPNWTVEAINITYSNETYTPGTASFALSNSITNKTESLTCPLTFNSLCQISGTPNDETLQVLLQVNIDVAYMTLNQSWTCYDQLGQKVISTFVIGTGTLNLDCPIYAEDMTCNGPVGGTGLINGTVVATE
ncbi:hypothetical protein BR93DRAFT_962850 [Coniochaeta sp. PMI_546]|nr:hypothetical protein BR93DRAFT_962850 [Coniochaeta sp. PMI_546]